MEMCEETITNICDEVVFSTLPLGRKIYRFVMYKQHISTNNRSRKLKSLRLQELGSPPEAERNFGQY